MNRKLTRMMTRNGTLLLMAFAMALSLPARAASVFLEAPASVLQNQNFTVSLKVDTLGQALATPESLPGSLYSGGVTIDFDPALLSYNTGSLALQSGAGFLEPLTIGTSGGKQTLTFAFDGAPETGIVATLSFKAVGLPGNTADIGQVDFDDFSGSFARDFPTYQRLLPANLDITGTSVQISAVPLPGAAWLMLTGLAAVAGRARRCVKAGTPA